jgi:hypothetical protein
MRVLITDFLAESDFEREALPGVEVDALLSLIITHPRRLICARTGTTRFGLDHPVEMRIHYACCTGAVQA